MAGAAHSSPASPRGFLGTLNAGVYAVERILIGLFFATMSVSVFVHTMHGGMDKYGLASCGQPGMASCGSSWGATAAVALVFAAIGYAAMRSRQRAKGGGTRGGALLGALVVSVLGAGLMQFLVWAFPTGWAWSTKLALAMLLWVGLLGASLVTYERRHIHIEAVKKFLPPRLQHATSFIAHVLTAVLCAFVTFMGVLFTMKLYTAWAETGGRAAVVEQLTWLPEWAVAMGLPIAFGIMGLRFIGHAVASLRGQGGAIEKEMLEAERVAAENKSQGVDSAGGR